MAFVNHYSGTSVGSTGKAPDSLESYDLNFCFPVRVMETSLIKLVPLVPKYYAKPVFDLITQYPSVLRFFSIYPFPSLENFEAYLESIMRSDPGSCLFVILDKQRVGSETEADCHNDPEAILGVINYCNASPSLSTLEIGFVIVFPPYQRTHVATHAIGLMVQYALDAPGEGGLGVRRLQWQSHDKNVASIKAAQRMGFKMEATIRWQRPLETEKESSDPFRANDSLGVPGRHSTMLSMCWDDWDGGGRDHVLGQMNKRG